MRREDARKSIPRKTKLIKQYQYKTRRTESNGERSRSQKSGVEIIANSKHIKVRHIRRTCMFANPVQPALLPGGSRIDGFHVLIIGLPQGRDKEE